MFAKAADNPIDSSDDIIDVRDVIARYEALEDDPERDDSLDTKNEYALLGELLDNLKGYGGDEQWKGDWYPVTLIRDSYFENYAQELAEDCGMINPSATWPNNCIDWEKAARELQVDYSSVEFDGITYWYR